MTARSKDLKDALQALIDNPADVAAQMKAKRLLQDETVKIPVTDLTNDELKLQQGVGSTIAATTIPGTSMTYASITGNAKYNSIENGPEDKDKTGLQDLHDAVGKIPDYTGLDAELGVDSKLGEYVTKLSEKTGEEATSNTTPSDKEVEKAVEQAPEAPGAVTSKMVTTDKK